MILPPKPDLLRRLVSRLWLAVDYLGWLYDEVKRALRG